MGLKGSVVAIVGVGLMGGSLGLALRERRLCRKVWGVDRDRKSVDRATALGAIDEGTCDLWEGTRGAQVVILATPVRTIIELIKRLGPHLPQGCLLFDLGSTKGKVVGAMGSLPGHIQPLGGHPMCGKDVSGIEFAEPNLYVGATFVLTPLDRTSEEAKDLAREVVEGIGAVPLIMDPYEHDRLVAATSHLPYLLAVSLMSVTQRLGAKDGVIWKLAASGFRDTTRLAGSDPTVMSDILLTNSENLRDLIDSFSRSLNHVGELAGAGEEKTLEAELTRVQRQRRSL